ncbi:MAG: hypothetical protein AAFR59_04440, partial [Bacteroidota bacterium]
SVVVMRSWQEFQKLHPILLRIEQCFARLQKSTLTLSRVGTSGEKTVAHWEDRREWYENQIRTDLAKINAQLYPWLAPFYIGDFGTLQQAIRTYRVRGEGQEFRRSEVALRYFFSTLPNGEKMKLGFWLDRPDLVADIIELDAERQILRNRMKNHLDICFAN